MSYRVIRIQKTKRSYLSKIEKRIWDIIQLDNLVRLFINKHDDKVYDWASQFTLEKIPRKKLIIDENLQAQMFDLFQKLGFGITTSITSKLAQAVKAVLQLRKHGKKARLPKPTKFKYISSYSIRLGGDNYTIKDRKLIIFLGRKRDSETPKLSFKLPDWLDTQSIKSDGILLKWVKDAYVEVHITYEAKEDKQLELDKDNWISIDFGFRNFAAVVSNKLPSLLINGKSIKDFFKSIHKYASSYQSQNNLRAFRLIHKYRKNILDYVYHTITNTIIELCIRANVGTIYYGKNIMDVFKETSQFSKEFNKFFRWFSFGRFIQILKYKAEAFGIDVIPVDESYTSQTDPITQNQEDFIQRAKDVLRCKSGIYHADLAAAYNIARKIVTTSNISNLKAKLTRPFKVLKMSKLTDSFKLDTELKRFKQCCMALIGHTTQTF